MISFKSFSSTSKKFFINSNGYAVLNPGPGIGLTSLKNPLKEENIKKLSSLHTLPGQYQPNSDHSFTVSDRESNNHYNNISKELTKHQSVPTVEESKHIRAFTTYSGVLNKKLIDNHKQNKPENNNLSSSGNSKVSWNTHEQSIHDTIKKLASKPIGKELHVYAGVGYDPSIAARESKDNILHSPAHISTSHDIHTAHEFTRNQNFSDKNNKKVDHIMHIHLKSENKAYHIGKKASSQNRDQNETVLPSGTKLKYFHTTYHDNGYGDANHYAAIHHFTIHT